MKITIITVAYNSARTIEDTIRSVLSQTHQDIEYIVVDGGSTDGTLGIVDKYRGKIARSVSGPDKGIYDAMNKGLALATGEVIGFLNSDDFYAQNSAIETVAQAMQNSELGACYADLVYVKQNKTDQIVRYWRSSPYRAGRFGKGWVPPHPTFFARSSTYAQLGGYDISFPVAADFELMVRFLARHQVPSAYLPRLLVCMRTGGASNGGLGSIIRQNMEIYRALKKNSQPVSPLYPLYKLIEKNSQFFKRPGNGLPDPCLFKDGGS